MIKIRKITPLWLRKLIGPIIAYVVYWVNIHILKNRKRPRVLSIIETIDLVINENLSVIRFGDGEMSLINNSDLAFQQKNNELAKRLVSILQTNIERLLICIPGIWEDINGFNKKDFWFNIHHLFRYGPAWKEILPPNKIYGNSFITRPYLNFKDKSQCEDIFKRLFSIWSEKDIILIEGAKSRIGVGNDMFNATKSVQRILCPAENAYSKYNEIMEETTKAPKNKLILISLGPTAKILAFDLFKEGYRVIDIGHLDMEYEMFLKQETKIVKIKYKYFNEINERNPEPCLEPDYLNQIIARIE